jgi:predicted alpha/beta-fold hydrolase
MITQSQFRPAFGIANPHLQTLLPYLITDSVKKHFTEQTLELDDGDFLDLSWSGKPVNGKPIIVIFHGLESSIDSHYVPKMMHTLKRHGWTSLLMHFRGCSGRPNRLARSYHSGETGDARYLCDWLRKHYPDSPLTAIGYSLGGNMLLKLQAEYTNNSPLEAAVSVCAPVHLDLCADRINQGFSRIYQRHLVSCLKQKILDKANVIDYKELIGMSTEDIKRIKTFWEFDNLVTAPLHGFKDVHDYYGHASAYQYLKDIKKPTLMIHALDDPFMTTEVIPDESELSDSVELELCQYGGHIGFISGSLYNPVFWLQQRIPEYLSNFIPRDD